MVNYVKSVLLDARKVTLQSVSRETKMDRIAYYASYAIN